MSTTTASLIAYIAMLIFDLAVLAGTAYFVGFHDWSAWWFLLAAVLCGSSTPSFLCEVKK